MSGRKGLILDANILLRAVFGQRVAIMTLCDLISASSPPDP